jgi:peptidoglycan/LPS O-acetylase OafA/YrhL
MIMQNKRLIIIVMVVALLLLMPLIAMQFTDEVNWTLFDFIVAGVLLLGTGLMCELVMRKVKKIRLRIAICVALLIMLLLIWAELAVGIFGSPFSGQ